MKNKNSKCKHSNIDSVPVTITCIGVPTNFVLCLRYGAQIDQQDRDGNTPLILAAGKGKLSKHKTKTQKKHFICD